MPEPMKASTKWWQPSPRGEASPVPAAMLPELRAFLRYWLSIKPSGALPARSDVDPLAIDKTLIPHVFLMEFASDETEIRFTLVGSHTRDAIGTELTGKSSRALTSVIDGSRERFHDHILSLYRLAREHRSPVHSRGVFQIPDSSMSVVTERLTCPMLARDGRTVTFSGVQKYAGPAERVSRFWQLGSDASYEVEFVRPLDMPDIEQVLAADRMPAVV